MMVSVMAGEPAPIEGTPFPADVLADISVPELFGIKLDQQSSNTAVEKPCSRVVEQGSFS
jgi:hypothetical protein